MLAHLEGIMSTRIVTATCFLSFVTFGNAKNIEATKEYET